MILVFAAFFALCLLEGSHLARAEVNPSHFSRFQVQGDQFFLDKKPFVIYSGEIHYPRIPHQYWRDRLRKAKAMGLNTITTYVFWNLHESRPGRWDFSGDLDLPKFLKTAQEEGLYVILRPGPYICTELDFGGFPTWLLKDKSLTVRSSDPKYLSYAGRYLHQVGKVVAPYLIENGGPIILTQVENEYGSYGRDHRYTAWVRDTLRDSGFHGQLYTADGPGQDMLSGGTLPDLPIALNFGGGAPGAFEELNRFRPGGPRMVGEYWCGWFDHWGHPHQTTQAEGHLRDIRWCLQNGVSFSLYMFAGGTSFGFMAGANGGAADYQLDTTSYDYDSPVDESGRITPKYLAFRQALSTGSDAPLPPIPSTPAPIHIGITKLARVGSLFDTAEKPVASTQPQTFEELDQAHGLILYRTRTNLTGRRNLEIGKLSDYALVYLNGKKVGTLDRQKQQRRLELNLPEGGSTLDLWVECHARINFGGQLPTERKGIEGGVSLDGHRLPGWNQFQFPLDPERNILASLRKGATLRRKLYSGRFSPGPSFYVGTLYVKNPGDTFLDLSHWNKGFVWVNGHNLGRFWNIGPQQTLFLPGPWLNAGANRILVLDEGDSMTNPTIEGLAKPILNEAHQEANKLHRKPGQNIRLEGALPVWSGDLLNSKDMQTVSFEKPTTGRYLCIETTEAWGKQPYSSLAELWAIDTQGQLLNRKDWKVVYADSEETESEDGSVDNLIDNQPTTIWHTQWGSAQPGQPHQVVIDLGSSHTISGIKLLPRQEGVNGRIRSLRVFLQTQPFQGL